MDALRVRFASLLEWVVAAGFFVATLGVALLIFQGVRNPVTPASAAAPVATIADIPAAVPKGAVSVPVLPFRDGKEVRLGDSAAAVAERLGHTAETGREEADAGRLGRRLTRFYDYAGFRFVIVYEPFERNGEWRVSAIYLP
jgi:hypothetical protein